MHFKVIFLVCLTVYLCDADDGQMKLLLNDVCNESNTPACHESARKCLAPHHELTPEQRKEWHTNYCKMFHTCLDKTSGSKAVYEKFVREHHGGKDWCAEDQRAEDHKEHSDAKKIHFTDFLAQAAGEKVSADLECCMAKQKGKFTADGKVNVAAWKEYATKIVDAAAKKAYVEGIDACAASNPVCSMHDFKVCVMKKCHHAVHGH